MDLGSGFGPLIDNIFEINKDIKISAIEPDIKSRELGQHYKEINFFENINTIIERKIKFDIITAFHTFEHIKDPIRYLKDLKKILNENGKIYIEVPDGEGIWFKKTFAHLAHPQIYSKYSITKFSSLAGFKVSSYFNPTNEIEEGQNLAIELINDNEDKIFDFKLTEKKNSLEDKFNKAEWTNKDKLFFYVKKILVFIIPLRIAGLIARTLQDLRK